jgi:hypothetical protein
MNLVHGFCGSFFGIETVDIDLIKTFALGLKDVGPGITLADQVLLIVFSIFHFPVAATNDIILATGSGRRLSIILRYCNCFSRNIAADKTRINYGIGNPMLENIVFARNIESILINKRTVQTGIKMKGDLGIHHIFRLP